MTRKRKVSELVEFDASEFLNSDEDVAAYLTAVLEENDQALLAAALVHRQPRRAGIGPGGPLVGGCRGTAVDQPTFEKAGHSAGDCVAVWRSARPAGCSGERRWYEPDRSRILATILLSGY